MKRKKFIRYSLSLLGLSTFKSSKLFGFYTAGKKLLLNKVRFIWCGAVTTSSIKVHASLTSTTSAARLVVSTNPSLSNPVYGSYAVANASNNFVAPLFINGLAADTQYYYAVEADGIIDTAADAIGKFKTVKGGPQSFRFTIASCNNSGAHPAWLRIKDKAPFLHITHGDFHYGDPNSATDINVHRAPLEAQLAQPAVKSFLQSAPIAYTWDDHDYCGDNTDSTAVGRTNARLTFQEYVPHYPLVAGNGNVPIYQAFIIGRIRFILTDLRSEKGAVGTSMMGAAQKAWFKNECVSAKSSNQQIIWINSVPWGPTVADAWTGYDAERTELSDFFKANAIVNLMIICGDMHMVGIDNGANHDFATGGNPFKYPVIQAAAVNQVGSYRGGTFSEGYFTNPGADYGQYMLIDVTDNDNSGISFSITGYRVDNTGAETVMLTYSYTTSTLTVLPVIISKFSVRETGAGTNVGALLSWQLQQPANDCKQITIERSNNGAQFHTLHTMPCSNRQDYSFTDASPLDGRSYYRLKITGTGNQSLHSTIESIVLNNELAVTVVANPLQDQLLVEVISPQANASEYLVVDAAGKLIVQNKFFISKGRNTIIVNMQPAASGTYFFVLKHATGQTTKKFLVE